MSWLHLILIPVVSLVALFLLGRGLRADAEQIGEWKLLRPGPKDYAIVLGGAAGIVFLVTMVQLGLTRIHTDPVEGMSLLALLMFLAGSAIAVWLLSFMQRTRFNEERIEWTDMMLQRRAMKFSEIAEVHHGYSAGWSHVWSAKGERLTIMHSNHGAAELLQRIRLPNMGSVTDQS